MKVAVVLDVDGVLVKGGEAIPEAMESLHRLAAAGVPFVFVTNAGALTEGAKILSIRKTLLGAESKDYPAFLCEPERVVTASSPFALHPICRDPTRPRILMITNPPSRSLALELAASFLQPADTADSASAEERQQLLERQVVTLDQIRTRYPDLWPARKLYDEYCSPVQEKRDQPHAHPPLEPSLEESPIRAVFVTQHPPDWGEAFQYLVDILEGNGSVRGLISTSAAADSGAGIPVLMGNPDFDYKDTAHTPRMTLGAFTHCLEAVYERATGRKLEVEQHGKPFVGVYEIALERLSRQCVGSDASQFDAIFCVGDNPVSDVRGAGVARKELGLNFQSILTCTGCFVPSEQFPNDPNDPADLVVKSIKEAVDHILKVASA